VKPSDAPAPVASSSDKVAGSSNAPGAASPVGGQGRTRPWMALRGSAGAAAPSGPSVTPAPAAPTSTSSPQSGPAVPPAEGGTPSAGGQAKPRPGLTLRGGAGASPAGVPAVSPAAAAPVAGEAPTTSASAAPTSVAATPAAAPAPYSAPDGSPAAGSAAPEVKPVPASPAGGVVIPLFREGSDSRRTTVASIVFAALLVFGVGIAVIWLLMRPSPEEVAAKKAAVKRVAAAGPSAAPSAPAAQDPAVTPAPTAAPRPAASGDAPVVDLLALGSASKFPDPEADLTSPRRFRVIPEAGAHPDVIRWVEEARVAGVTVGNPPRALINGRLVRGGALVDPTHGIVFLGLDAERRVLVFRSSAGDVVRLEY